jgi:ATP-dependent DNA ligase
MDLAVAPPLSPMLARSAAELPRGKGWLYEPKWDGFRAILFRCRDDVVISSRNGRPLQDRFPELVAAARAVLPERCVIDGEIVVATADGPDFDALLHRFDGRRHHPAALVAFDLLCVGDRDRRSEPFARRRILLEANIADNSFLCVSPQTDDLELAQGWLREWGARGFEGAVAKRAAAPYRAGMRALVKVKSTETADFVVGGYRGTPGDPACLLLGAYDRDGVLRHVGQTTVLSARQHAETAAVLAPLEGQPSFPEGSLPPFHDRPMQSRPFP